MPRWTCPRCDREFGAARQAHACVPGITVDDRVQDWLSEAYDFATD